VNDFGLPAAGWLISKGAALQVAFCRTGDAILGYNRKRDLAWDTVILHKAEGEEECVHVWTTRGDCPMLPSTKLSTTHGVITGGHLANLVREGEEVRVEIPRLRRVDGLVCNRTTSGVTALLRPRLLPFCYAGKPILRIHTSSRQPVVELLAKADLKVKTRADGQFWSWVVFRDELTEYEAANYQISMAALEVVNVITRVTEDDMTEWRFSRQETLFRVFQQLNFSLADEPFEVSVTPKINPMEIILSPVDAWQPYARTLAVTRSKCTSVKIEFATPSFTPLVNNFMIL
jgi:hypothetical protein